MNDLVELIDETSKEAEVLKEFEKAENEFEESISAIRGKDSGNNEDKQLLDQAIKYMVAKDNEKAASLLEKAANNGYMGAQYLLGEFYFTGMGVEQDGGKAVYWFTKAARQNHADAQNWLGTLFHEGTDVPENRTKAKYWFRRAAKQGHEKAWRNLYNNNLDFSDTKKIKYSIIGGLLLGSIIMSMLGFIGFIGGAIVGWIIGTEIRKRL